MDNLLERVFVASDAFSPSLEKLQILDFHDGRYVPVEFDNADLVLARAAGFDTGDLRASHHRRKAHPLPGFGGEYSGGDHEAQPFPYGTLCAHEGVGPGLELDSCHRYPRRLRSTWGITSPS